MNFLYKTWRKPPKKATKVLPVNCKRMTDCWCMTYELSLSKKLKGYKVKGRSRTGSGEGKNLWTFDFENERLLKQRVLGTQQPKKSNSSLFCQIDCHYTAAQWMLSPSRHFPQALYPVIQCDICTLMLRECASVCVRVCRYLTHVYSLLAWYWAFFLDRSELIWCLSWEWQQATVLSCLWASTFVYFHFVKRIRVPLNCQPTFTFISLVLNFKPPCLKKNELIYLLQVV